MIIRLATIDDAEAMLAIYAPHVVGSSVSFEWELPTLSEFKMRISEILQELPWFVAEDEDEQILGYAYAAKYRTRTAYQWAVETSVYVAQKKGRSGVGRNLYGPLIDTLKKQGFTTAFAVIALPNERSVLFHESMGFNYLCTYPKIGFKLNSWHDVGWWQLELNTTAQAPRPPIPLQQLVLGN